MRNAQLRKQEVTKTVSLGGNSETYTICKNPLITSMPLITAYHFKMEHYPVIINKQANGIYYVFFFFFFFTFFCYMIGT